MVVGKSGGKWAGRADGVSFSEAIPPYPAVQSCSKQPFELVVSMATETGIL